MSGRADDDFDAQLAEQGDDRPGLDDLETDDFSGLLASVDDDEEYLDDDEDADDSGEEADGSDDEDDESDEEDEDSDDEDADDYPEDALEDEIDLVAALYREDGGPAALALPKDLANDFDELVEQLRRVPGDAGSVGVVVIDSDFFVLVRVRGKKIEVLLSDVLAGNDWPIARDAADFLGEDIPDDEDESVPVGDFDMFADAGLSEFDLEQICSDMDADPLDLVSEIVRKLGFSSAYKKVVASLDL